MEHVPNNIYVEYCPNEPQKISSTFKFVTPQTPQSNIHHHIIHKSIWKKMSYYISSCDFETNKPSSGSHKKKYDFLKY